MPNTFVGSFILEEVKKVSSGITLQIKYKVLQSLLIILTTLLIWQARITVDKTVVKEITEVRKLVWDTPTLINLSIVEKDFLLNLSIG